MHLMVRNVNSQADILRLAGGFRHAQALLTATTLGLFTLLCERGACEEEEIRMGLRLHGRGLRHFLDLLTACGLLERVDGRYANSAGADVYLVQGRLTYLGCFLEHATGTLYPAWTHLSESLRGGQPQHSGESPDHAEDADHLLKQVWRMDAVTHFIGPALATTLDWSGYRSILDLGGARGNVVATLVRSNPRMSGHVFDIPAMRPLFDEHIARYGLTGRVHFHGGDFFTDPLPGADVVLLGHVLSMMERSQRARLVARAFQTVRPGGALVVYDRMLGGDTGNTGDTENLVSSLTLLLTTRGGSEYPTAELVTLAGQAGFVSTEIHPLTKHDTAVVCHKAS